MQKTVKTLSVDECEKLLIQLKYFVPEKTCGHIWLRNYTMGLFLLDAGLRVGELVQLRQKHVQFAGTVAKAVVVTSDIAKLGIERTVPFTERLHHALELMMINYWGPREGAIAPYCFYLNDPERPLCARQVQRIIKKAAIACIGRPITPHTLRHTFATRLMRKTSTRIVQQLLGHKNLSSTQIYTHPNDQDLRSAIEKI